MDVVRTLINANASVNLEDNKNQTALHWGFILNHIFFIEYNTHVYYIFIATGFGNASVDIVNLLIKGGADINHQSSSNKTALMLGKLQYLLI